MVVLLVVLVSAEGVETDGEGAGVVEEDGGFEVRSCTFWGLKKRDIEAIFIVQGSGFYR